ncbi:aldo/keto reductase [Microbacterium sp. H1-D42]|uniref:aldo/keto reductase n=1 Tax=Microbacterium sp. H1-D42 TaxID=2925844 RepID=UPI001F52EB62|nr:aldo/keto reductase [Microbacterium sp. H1-D42]UNK70508.1 aldo/keto reductase [Microbacterium sp. H1-D42]
MRKRSLRTGLPITRVGLGGAQLGNLGRVTTEEQAHGAVHTAWERGVRLFDTAPHYGLGLSEQRLGALLAEFPRDELVLSTKAGRTLVPQDHRPGQLDDGGFAVPAAHRREWDFSRDGVLRGIEESMRRLAVDRLDIVYLHDPDGHWEQASTAGVPALIELREQGVVGAIGVGMNQSALPARFVRETDIDVVMLAGRFTLLEQPALDDLLPAAVERSVGIVNVGVYNSGLLSRPQVASDATYDYLPAPRALIERASAIAAVCEQFGTDLPTAAMQFSHLHPAVVSVVVGCRDAAQVTQNIDRDEAIIPPELWDALVSQGLIPEFRSN